MKLLATIKILFASILLLCIVSCGSGNHFASRKYQPGKYIAHQQKPDKVKVTEKTETGAQDVATEKTISVDPDVKKEPVYAADKTKESENVDVIASKSNTSSETLLKKSNTGVKEFKAKALLQQIITKKDKMLSSKKFMKAEDKGNDPTALVGFILGILGVAADIMGFIIVLGTLEYTFMLLFIVGLFLGIGALIFGTKGLSNHRKNGGSSVDLVFSIIGTVFGGLSILMAIVFSFYSLILYLVGL